jgi:hypothetical protein
MNFKVGESVKVIPISVHKLRPRYINPARYPKIVGEEGIIDQVDLNSVRVCIGSSTNRLYLWFDAQGGDYDEIVSVRKEKISAIMEIING